LPNFVSNILGGAKSQVVNGAGTALSQLAQGDVKGAIASLNQTAGDLVTNAADRGAADFGDDLGGMNARGDAMQNWCWYCLLPSIQNANAISLPFAGAPSMTLPWYYVEEATLPQRAFTHKQIDRNGHIANYVEGYTTDGLSLTFFLDSSNRSLMYLNAWCGQMVGNKDASNIENRGVWGLPKNYKKDITMIVTDVTKKTLITAKYFGCMPKDPSTLDLVSGQADRLKMKVDFAIDDVQITLQSADGLLSQLLTTAEGYGMSALQGVSAGFVKTIQGSISGLGGG
jgi:hypothetical protein